MANTCDTSFRLTGSSRAVKDLWNTLKAMNVENKDVPLYKLAEHYGIDYEKRHISVRGFIYWAEFEEREEDFCVLSLDVESAWTPTAELFEAIKEKLDKELYLCYRAIEPGCEIFEVYDPNYCWFTEGVYISACGEPFSEDDEGVCDTVADAIDIWCDRMNIEQGERTDEEMVEFINSYTYEDDAVYFNIYEFDFI
jgi:hypothetical protein